MDYHSDNSLQIVLASEYMNHYSYPWHTMIHEMVLAVYEVEDPEERECNSMHWAPPTSPLQLQEGTYTSNDWVIAVWEEHNIFWSIHCKYIYTLWLIIIIYFFTFNGVTISWSLFIDSSKHVSCYTINKNDNYHNYENSCTHVK